MDFRSPSSDIDQSRIWSNFSLAYFVPLSDIKRYTERSKMMNVLDRVFPLQLDRDILVERVSATAPRLYCILLYIGQVCSLQDLIENDFSDSKILASDATVLSDLQALVDWKEDLLDRFLESRWLFSAPCFEEGSSDIILLPKMPLPFVYDAATAKVAARNSIVSQIQMHEAHQNIFKPNGIPRPMLALKSFHGTMRSRFEKELRILQILRQKRTRHIIKLIASFSSCVSYCLLFPWAEMNLREFLVQRMGLNERLGMRTWVLNQMAGLAQGLSVIHQCNNSYDGTIAYGRHGDLHPLNILLINTQDGPVSNGGGILQLSSMGLAYFFHSPEEFNIPQHTGMYEAPECQLERRAGPSYDVWSLGCIFLEMLVWLSEGPQGLEQFALARLNPDPIYREKALDDYFFTLQGKGEVYIGAEVRPSVKVWIERCKNYWNADHVFEEVIYLIEKHILQPDPDRRLASSIIYAKLQNLCDHA